MNTITSKGMTLIVISTGKPVKLNDRIGEFVVTGGTSPMYDGAVGRVYLKNTVLGNRAEAAPNSIGLAWRELA